MATVLTSGFYFRIAWILVHCSKGLTKVLIGCLTQRNWGTLQTRFQLYQKKAKRCWALSTLLFFSFRFTHWLKFLGLTLSRCGGFSLLFGRLLELQQEIFYCLSHFVVLSGIHVPFRQNHRSHDNNHQRTTLRSQSETIFQLQIWFGLDALPLQFKLSY